MKRALYIGRFNPIHLGHMEAIQYIFKSEKDLDQLIIGIGTAQESYTIKNPFNASERFEFILNALKELQIPCDNYLIVPIPDVNNNNQWISYLLSYLPRFSVIYSNNSLVRLLTERNGTIKIKTIPLIKREEWSATTIRKKIIESDNSWLKAVPNSVLKLIRDFNGVERIQLLAQNDT